jgi:hypothetical protein
VTLDVNAVPLRENPSTLKKTNALPLWPEPPSQPASRAATATARAERRIRTDRR